jgi:hypothetical protein
MPALSISSGLPTGIRPTPNPSRDGGEAGAVFDFNGRRISVTSVSSAPSVLPKGVYIVNGKKILIK